MSRLIEKLNRVCQPPPQPMGFMSARPTSEKPRLQLVVEFNHPIPENIADFIKTADAVIFRLTAQDESKPIEDLCRSVDNIPCGIWPEKTSAETLSKLAAAGNDFLVFDTAAALAVSFPKNKVGKILEIDPLLEDSLLRTVDDLMIDAVTLSDKNKSVSLTWNRLMQYRRIAMMQNKPLLVSVSTDITGDELQALWDAGVSGIILEAGTGNADKLVNIRQEMDKLTFSIERRRGKVKALVPHISFAEPEHEEEEEEDE
jgi:hypothetical protein